jgi:hypothetical protein
MFTNVPRADLALLFLGACLLCLGILKCTPAQLEALEAAGWSAADCGLHSSLGCAGQAAGACELPSVTASENQWGTYAECMGSVAQGCMIKSLARCTLAGVARVVSGPIVAGSSGCGSEETAHSVQVCIAGEEVGNERQAVEASAKCWREACGF